MHAGRMDREGSLGHAARRLGESGMIWAAAIRQTAYDPDTVSMLSSVLERAVASLPHPQRTDECKDRLASSILAAAARGERDPIKLYAMALGAGAWEPSVGGTPPTSPPLAGRRSI
jgi:hypothetical protein